MPFGADVLVDGSEFGAGGRWAVVETDDREFAGDADSKLARGAQRSKGHNVRETHEGSGALRCFEEPEGEFVTVYFAQSARAGSEAEAASGEPVAPSAEAFGRVPAEPVVGAVDGDGRDVAVSVAGEIFGGIAGPTVVIDVDRGDLVDGLLVDGDKRKAALEHGLERGRVGRAAVHDGPVQCEVPGGY